jgi:signal transduction histidine kinase/CheY-like chemotaxis protein
LPPDPADAAPAPADGIAQRAFAQAPFGLLSFGDDGRVVYANPRLHRWLKAAPGRLLGQAVDKLMTPGTRVFHSTHFFPLLKLHGLAEEVFLMLSDAEGQELPVLASGTREVHDGRGVSHCALMLMCRRKEFEGTLLEARRAAEAATAARDEFLAVVSHELRTPLSAILGWINIAKTGKLDATLTQRAFETIERSARAQSMLIEDLLDVSRIVSGKLRLSPRAIELATLTEAAADTVRPAAQAKNVELQLLLDRDAGIVYADPDRLQQVAWNLLSNAVKFTPRGGRVQVTLARAGSRVQLQVRDTGEGIAPSQLPYVFDRFWQAANGQQRERSGLGLGLAICKSLAELHGGSIRADSAGPGEGAVFTVELPLAIAAARPEARTGAGNEAEARVALDGARVLVVDDDQDARDMLRALLAGAGAEIRSAASFDEAVTLLEHEPVDLLLSDIGLPHHDGYELVRHLRSAAPPERRHIPAVAITGLARPQDRIALLRAGFQAHLAKPVDPVELLALVAALRGHGGAPSIAAH